MIPLSKALQGSIRFETNYQHLLDTLFEINKPRFRGLGEDHNRKFVKAAVDLGDHLEFTRVGSISYLLFLMNWLGSYFYTDPRYANIAQALKSKGTEAERIEATRMAFLECADRHIGEDVEILADRLQNLDQFEPKLQDASYTTRDFHKTISDAWGLLAEPSSYSIDFIETRAQEMAMRLKADTERGQKTCLLLTILLGVNADQDPLYPWINDTAVAAHAELAAVDVALIDYSKKRLAAVLRSTA